MPRTLGELNWKSPTKYHPNAGLVKRILRIDSVLSSFREYYRAFGIICVMMIGPIGADVHEKNTGSVAVGRGGGTGIGVYTGRYRSKDREP